MDEEAIISSKLTFTNIQEMVDLIAMKPFPFIFRLNSEYFEYRQGSNRFTNKSNGIFNIFGQNQNVRDRDMFVKIFLFLFSFSYMYIMLMLKEFCISQGSHSKNLVNQPTPMKRLK